MVIKVDRSEWDKQVSEKSLPLFFNSRYHDSIQSAFKVDRCYYSYKSGNKIIGLVALFFRGNRAFMPEPFSYLPFWFDETLKEGAYLSMLKILIGEFKSSFSSISLKLPTNFTDVRPFQWNDFVVQARYTYIHNGQADYHKSVLKHLRKPGNNTLRLSIENKSRDGLDRNLKLLAEIGVKKSTVSALAQHIQVLGDLGLCKYFNIIENGVLVASQIVLEDQHQAYLLLLTSNKISTGSTHTFLYSEVLSHYREKAMRVDFMGANLESISAFKASFNPKLVPYFIVRYSRSGSKARKVLAVFKKIARTYLIR